MKNLSYENIKYLKTIKEPITTCSRAVKKPNVKKILLDKVVKDCNRIGDTNYKPVLSKLHYSYSSLIGNAVSIAVEVMGDLFKYGEYTGDFTKEIGGIKICQDEMDYKYIEKFQKYKAKVLEFKNNKNKVTLDTMGNLFDYVIYMALFEKVLRGESVNIVFHFNEQLYPSLLNEIKDICKIVYVDFMKPNKEKIKSSYLGNPVFGTNFSGVAADGDFMIGEGLYDLKTKKNPIPSDEDICQLALYYLLSRCRRITKRDILNREIGQPELVEKLFIYNTRYGHTFEIKIKDLDDNDAVSIMREIYIKIKNG